MSKSHPRAFSAEQLHVLRDLVAADPSAKQSDLAAAFTAATGRAITPMALSVACQRHGIARQVRGKPKAWSDEEIATLRRWLAEDGKQSLRTLVKRIRESMGRTLSTGDLPALMARFGIVHTWRRGLQPAHALQVRQVVDAHPGVGLVRLAPLVAEACGLQQLNPKVLRRFLSAQGIELPSQQLRSAQKRREAEARDAMVSWLDRGQLARAVGPAVKDAMAWCLRVPDPQDG